MKKPITKPKQRTSEKMIKKGKGVVATLGKKKSIAEKSGTASARTHKTVVADLNRKDSAALKKIETENWQLTRELQQKNRTLEIEAALEKVRAASSAMVKTEELSNVVSVMYKQFELLQVNQVAFELALCDEAKNQLQFWSSSHFQKILPECYIVKKSSHSFFRKQWTAWKTKKDRLVIILDGLKQKEFHRFIFNQTDFEKFPTQVKQFIRSRKKDVFTHAWMKYGLLEAVTDEALSDEDFDLLQRFAKVFEQTYTRFLDLQKAEAQTREAQIEAALERVRSRSMSMHRSSELAEVSGVLYEELIKLGIKGFVNCGFVEVDEKKKEQHGWTTMPDGSQAEGYYLPLFGDEVLNERYKSWQRQVPTFHQRVTGKRLRKHLAFATPTLGSKQIEEIARRSFPDPTIFYCFNFRQGYLHVITGNTFSELHEAILVRFGKAFEQTYTRFHDLQKAEAQARDAQIEAALERVRARALAMHTSEELKEVALVLREQIDLLGQTELNGMVVELYETHPKHIESWFAFLHPAGDPNAKMVTGVILFEKKSCAVMREMIKKYQGPLKQYTIEASGNKIKEFYKILQPLVPEAGNVPKQEFYHCADFSGGTLLLSSMQEPSSESKDLLMRSASVFDLAYRRLLDLKKAEAQAREAEIELALERVRAKTMAMQKSEELRELVFEYYKQIHPFGFAKWGFEIKIAKEDKSGFYCWMSPPGARVQPEGFNIPTLNHWVLKKFWSAYEQQIPITSIVNSGADKRKLAVLLLEKSDMKNLPEDVKRKIIESEYVHFSVAAMRFGLLKAVDIEPVPEKDSAILQRFAKVFEQTYTRFLDLQKAEAQAREAKIEAALERVRASMMAMHRSDELRQVIASVFEQLKGLGFYPGACSVAIYNDDFSSEHWFAGFSHEVLPKSYKIPYCEHPYYTLEVEAWKKGLPFDELYFEGKPKLEYARWLFKNSDFQYLPDEFRTEMLSQKRLVISNAYMRYGFMEIVSNEALNQETISVLKRFAKVFEQTYTRFLDLQKAEAQAREAQIEAALERVRARALAMHESKDMADASGLLFKELRSFEIHPFTCGYEFIDQIAGVVNGWIVSPDGNIIPNFFSYPLNGDPVGVRRYDSWKRKELFLKDVVSGKANRDHGKFMSRHFNESFRKDIVLKFPEEVVFYTFNFSNGWLIIVSTYELSNTHEQIIARFTKVFEQTYTRFLDLQKAEAQAREAQIEAALERVRARSMAMHRSDELSDVVALLFAEIRPFGFASSGIELILPDEPNDILQFWTTSAAHNQVAECFNIPRDIHPFFQETWQAWKDQFPRLTQTLEGQEKKKFDRLILTKTDFQRFPEEVKQFILNSGHQDVFSSAIMKHGLLESVDTEPISDGQFVILERFAKVFEQTYTRFLDLQKAEAQAREAQIEAALERVRSRSMAMHRSDELSMIVGTLYKEMEPFGFSKWACSLNLFNEKTQTIEVWVKDISDTDHQRCYYWHGRDNESINELWLAWEAKVPTKTFHFKGEKKRAFDNYLFDKTDYAKFPAEVKSQIRSTEEVYFNLAYFKFGYLVATDYEELSTESIELLQRFAKVFEQTYTRFLDLQKAEAQTREAQIEIALERIRARALAMHSSEELLDVARVLREQMGLLGQQQLYGCVVELYETNPDYIESWHAFRPEGTKEDKMIEGKVYFAKDSCEVIREMIDRYQGPENEYTIEASGDKLDEWHGVLVAVVPEVRTYWSSMESMPTIMYFHCADFSGGTLLTASADPIAKEVKGLQARASNVFDLAYRRFLDLKKAEAQAREAEIQLALERIRARTMAMHKSEELSEVAALLFNQLKLLGAELWTAGFAICKEDELLVEKWMSSPITGQIFDHLFIPYNADHGEQSMYDTWKNKVELYSYVQGGKELKDIYDHLMTIPSFKANFQKVIDAGRPLPVWQKNHVASYKYGYLLIITESEFGEEDVFIRFAKVFEQTYTRFLDLQKAEAQAREAQIEVSLERVRARAMAMHKSEELGEAAVILFKEFRSLGIDQFINCGYVIVDETNKKQHAWMTTPDGHFLEQIHLPLTGDPVLNERYKSWKKKESLFHQEITGKVYKDHFDFVLTSPDYGSVAMEEITRSEMPDPVIFYCGNFSAGYLHLICHSVLNADQESILARFTRVFDLTYKRFLDLQKAEAQAREARIEAALERIRSRTMAMHKSDELSEVASLLFQQIGEMGIKVWTAGFNVWLNNDNAYQDWITSPKGGFIEPYIVDTTQFSVFIEVREAKQRGDDFFVQYVGGDTIKAMYGELSKFAPQQFEIMLQDGFEFPKHQYDHFVFGSTVSLMFITFEPLTEAHDIFKRFGKVFEQTYTRFLDLQKAEAQAREAQIEAALERVRASAMAMHKSDDLRHVVAVVFKELELSLNIQICILLIFNAEATEIEWWSTGMVTDVLLPQSYKVPLADMIKDNKLVQRYLGALQHGLQYDVFELSGETKRSWDRYLFEHTELKQMPKETQEAMMSFECVFLADAFMSHGTLEIAGPEPLPEDKGLILQRFAKVIDLTYRRVEDLQKAEAQAREAQIEAALERVRSRSMAMQKSTELNLILATMFTELSSLGVEMARNVIWIYNPEDRSVRWWAANPEADSGAESYLITYQDHPVYHEYWKAWEERRTKYLYILEGDNMVSWCDALFYRTELGKLPQEVQIAMRAPDRVYLYNTFNDFGVLFIVCLEPLPDEKFSIIERFGKVFDQSYTRFTDIQKAEAQAREAQIEAGLERVRARAMAMHKTDELREAGAILYKELAKLGIVGLTSAYGLMDEDEKMVRYYAASPADGSIMSEPMGTPNTETQTMRSITASWKKQEPYHIVELDAQETIAHQTFIAERSVNFPYTAAELISFSPKELKLHTFNFKQGYLLQIGGERLSADQIDIMLRFTKVFEMTYRRFLDLQKAEAQAREAQIEAALEKVRSRSMAMHKSDELLDVVNTVFEKLRDLNLPIDAAAIFVFEKEGYEYWFATAESTYPTGMHLPTRGNQVVDDISNAREAQVDFFSKLYSFDDKNQFFHNIFENTDFRHIPDERKKFLLECESLSLSVALETNSGIQLNSYTGKVLSPKEVDVLKRFTRVFEQAYTRFFDLQRAEAQARESQIEAALERVRSRSMAMQHSTELNEVLTTMFAELSSLGLALARCAIWTFNIEDRSARYWAANPEEESGTESFLIPYTDHPTCNEYWKSWEEKRTRYLYELSGETKRTWDDYLFNHTDMARLPEPVKAGMMAPEKVLLYNSFRDFGVLFAVSLEPLPEENFDIIERFGKVFDQSYTRFHDIQQAEAREMEAIRQASLDRVRAEIASMRTAKDLERITPLIWKELNTLSVPFVRCGVFIMDEDLQIIHNFLSTPDGKAIASFQLPYDTPGFVANILKHWQEKKMFLDHWDENGMKNFAQVLVNQGIFTEPGQYLKTLPMEGLYLHMLPFLQGMLYVGNTSQLAPENLALLLSLAETFSTAYARYEDFNKLEAAKQQVDKALVDLKQAQQQLVQSEKMASLGELTAGIAHEIQNPLNFVNNFSEVNEELLAEMKDELRNGKIDDALALADNVLENQKKINHHGKRADGIVKGMLQHSRSSSGVKEPTDINVLADEYLRLAFHGLRAKDKSFNAKFTTDFDPTLETINVVPQEIGRVMLNMINNAFYAVTEKQKKTTEGYEPTVTVSTKNSGAQILISVKDNGNGIPDSIKEKIFQPFFTTKPTGQGTGLGLSLAFDIVTKGHGGTLNVKSEEGGGSEFIIQIPAIT